MIKRTVQNQKLWIFLTYSVQRHATREDNVKNEKFEIDALTHENLHYDVIIALSLKYGKWKAL